MSQQAAGHSFDAWDPLLKNSAWAEFQSAYNAALSTQAAALNYASTNPYENATPDAGITVLQIRAAA
jgi:hypothetical protein